MENDKLTVGQLKAWIDRHDVPDDTYVFVQQLDTRPAPTALQAVDSVSVELTSNGTSNVILNVV